MLHRPLLSLHRLQGTPGLFEQPTYPIIQDASFSGMYRLQVSTPSGADFTCTLFWSLKVQRACRHDRDNSRNSQQLSFGELVSDILALCLA